MRDSHEGQMEEKLGRARGLNSFQSQEGWSAQGDAGRRSLLPSKNLNAPTTTDISNATDSNESEGGDVGRGRRNDDDDTVSLSNHERDEVPTLPTSVESPKGSDGDMERPFLNGVELTIGTYPRNMSDAKATMVKMWNNFKKMMGFSPECKNGGYKDLRGDCICPRYYEGNQCQNIVCINNGTRTMDEKCRCPYPDYVNGKHCEFIHCANGGKDLGDGTCQCIDPNWYTGQFCQHYTTSWLAAVGIPLIFIAVVIICCVVCRMDLCPRRGRSNRGRRSNARQQHAHRHQPATNQNQPARGRQPRESRERALREQELVAHENMLNDRLMRYLNEGRQCVVRLEPRPQSVLDPMIMMGTPPPPLPPPESEPKPWSNDAQEPPPTYEQAMTHATHRHLPPESLPATTRPPDYSPSPSPLVDNNDNPSGG